MEMYVRACIGERQGSDRMDADECEELQQTWWSKRKYDLTSVVRQYNDRFQSHQ